VVIDDGGAVARVGLRHPLTTEPDLYVVAAPGFDEEGLAAVDCDGPDVAVTHAAIDRASGVEAIPGLRARRPDSSVVIMRVCCGPDRIRDAIDAGGADYVPRHAEPKSSRSVRRSDQDSAWSPRVAKMLDELGSDRRVLAELTARERDVLALLAEGLRNRDIGRRLGIAEKTVKGRLTAIFDRIGVTDRIQAALWAHARRAWLVETG
jgi:DNA-binding NarL/FixJ family response regulator